MDPARLAFMARLLKEQSGLVLTEDKGYLLETRLKAVAHRHGLPTVEALIDRLRQDGPPDLVAAATDAMTTNETFFFRDQAPFAYLKDQLLPTLLGEEGRPKRLRVWCAAASTGQEPYSVAMVLDDLAGRLQGWQVDLLATDISDRALDRARQGRYAQFEVQRGLPVQKLLQHFDKKGDHWEVKPELKRQVQFRRHNLLDGLGGLGRFDVVLCRYVLIYMEQAAKRDILERIARQMSPGGILMLGGSETVFGISDRFVPVPGQRSIYRLQAGT